MRTLRTRLLIGTALASGLVLSAFSLAIYLAVRTALWAEFDEALGSKARSLAAMVEQEDGEPDLEFDEAGLPEFMPSERAEYYQCWDAFGRVLARSASMGGHNLEHVAGPADSLTFRSANLVDGRPGRFAWLAFVPREEAEDGEHEGNYDHHPPETRRDQPAEPLGVLLAVARDTLDIDQALGRLRLLLVCGCAAAMLVLVGVLSWSVRSGLKPLGQVAAEIAEIGEANLSIRLAPGATLGELDPIIARINSLLAQLEEAFAREKAFTADVSHELRTPLAGLRSTLEVALSKARPAEDYQDAMTKSLAICQRMQQLAENLLELARADAGQLQVASEAVDLVPLLQDCWGPFADRAAERRLDVVWSLPASYPIMIDIAKMRLVLTNLFDNACAYANTGGQIAVALRPEGSRTSLRVSNTGSRIAEADIARVFDRFWRGDAARTAEGDIQRYGLGLPLCQRVVTMLGGSISASTTHGGTLEVLIGLRADDGNPAVQ